VGHPQARSRAGARTRRGAGACAARRRGARRSRGGKRVRDGSPHLPLGRLGSQSHRAAVDARPRVCGDGEGDRPQCAPRRGRRLRLRREPRDVRRVLPLPHRPRAHVREDADPRRRPQRRLRPVRRRAGVGDLAERPLEAAAGDRNASGAVRERGVRPESRGRRRQVGGHPRLRPRRPVQHRHRARLGRRPRARVGPDAFPARARGAHGRTRGARPPRRRRRPGLVRRAQRRRAPRRRVRDVRRSRGDRRRVPHRPQRRPRDPVRDPGAAGGARRRRGTDLQEPERVGGERPGGVRHLVQDPVAARARRRRPAAADHGGAHAQRVRACVRVARVGKCVQDRLAPQRCTARGARRNAHRCRQPDDTLSRPERWVHR